MEVGLVRKKKRNGLYVVRCLCLLGLFTVIEGNAPHFSQFAFDVEPANVIAKAGYSSILNCSVVYHGDSTLQINWRKNSLPLQIDGQRRIKKKTGSLYFREVHQSSDEGFYQCVATVAELGTIVSRVAHLQIAYLENTFEKEPQDLTLYLNDTAMFACELDGKPDANTEWFKDNKRVTRKQNIELYSDGVLEISPIEYSHLGQYMCEKTNSEGSRSSRVARLLQVSTASEQRAFEKPQFVMKPSDKRAVFGSTIYLHCAANGRDYMARHPEISWLKDGITINLGSDNRLQKIGAGTLMIKNVIESDEGSYTCRASNSEDSVDAEATVTVLVPPQFISKPSNVFAHTNSDVKLKCDIYGVPKPMISWMKNGQPINTSDYFQIVDEKNLKILGLMEQDNGIYQCFGSNELGYVQASSQLIILQQDVPLPTTPPQFPHQFHTGALYSDAKNLPSAPTKLRAVLVSTRFVTLSWKVPDRKGPSDIIAYSVFWRETGSERERVTNTTTTEANIQHLKPYTQYEFRVRAFNRYGPSYNDATLNVKTDQEALVPTPPVSLVAVPISPTSIKVSWDAPIDSKGRITKYVLIYYEVGTVEEGDKEVNVQGTGYTLEGLKKYTEYSFRVVTHNENGPGASTTEQVARTFSDRPSDVPQNFTLEVSSATRIIVRWEPPSKDAKNGQITGYKIRYKKKGARRGDPVLTDGERNNYALTGLQKGTEYLVRISALTVNGSGPASPWQDATTYRDDLDETRVPPKPARLQAKPKSNSIIVTWAPPPPNSKVLVRGYELGYGKGVPDDEKVMLDANTHDYTIEGLEPISEYVISILAFNKIGPGPSRYETVFTSEKITSEPATPMMPPIGLKAIVLSSSTIVLTWADNSLGRSQKITDSRYYTVRYTPVQGNNRRHRFVNSTDLNAHIDNLRPYTNYEFAVKVTKRNRQSRLSMSIFNTTQEAAPDSEPRDLTTVPVEEDDLAVTLNWQPPARPNGLITGYLIFYSTDSEQDDRDWVVEGVVGDKLSTVINDLTPDTTYFFKVQARNSKGYGPMSVIAKYNTPAAPTEKELKTDEEGLNVNMIIIIIACVVGVTFCIVIAVVTVILCKKRDNANQSRTYKSPGKPIGQQNMKPPDLWIHQPSTMEMRKMNKSDQRSESNISVATSTLRRGSRGSSERLDDLPPCIEVDRRRNSFIGMSASESGYPSSGEERYQPIQPRNIIRPKPIMIPVDGQSREPIAVAMPNGHMHMEGPGGLPMRPVYPRTQYNTQYSSTPRVNAGDIPMKLGCLDDDCVHYSDVFDESYTNRIGYGPQSPDSSPSQYHQQYDQHQYGGHPNQPTKGIMGRPPHDHPLKSFSIPGPPGQNSPGTPTPKHIVKPQQNLSPYKKPTAPISSGPIKPRTPIPLMSKAPDVTLKTSKEEKELQKSLSTEELTAEMANLEGLMKDLNAITQQEFEC